MESSVHYSGKIIFHLAHNVKVSGILSVYLLRRNNIFEMFKRQLFQVTSMSQSAPVPEEHVLSGGVIFSFILFMFGKLLIL